MQPPSPHGHPPATIEDTDAEVDLGQHEGEQEAEDEHTIEEDGPAPLLGPETPPSVQLSGSSRGEAATWRRAAQSRVGQDPLATMTVAEAMLRTPRLIPEIEPLERVRTRLDERGRALMVVNAAGDLVGIVTRSDLRDRAPVENGRTLTAGDVAVRRLVTARPEETLRAATQRMSRLGLRQLPVLSQGTLQPVGLLRRSDVLEAYTRAVGEASPPLQGEQ